MEKSKKIIDEFFQKQLNPYASISAGKDSTVIMHLLYNIEPNIKFMSHKDEFDYPESFNHLIGLKKKYNLDLDILSPKVNLWDEIKKYDICEDIHTSGTEFGDNFFYNILKKYIKKNKFNAVFLGLRAQESKPRLWNFKKRGWIYFNKSWEQWVCQPIAHWSGHDVFAYLFSNNIPILDLYFKTKFQKDPTRIREGWLLPSHQAQFGQAVFLRYYYPEIYKKLLSLNNNIKNYV